MNKKALIVWGGWDGHEPEKVAHRFGKILENENFDVEISDTMTSYEDKEKLKSLDLIVPIVTGGDISWAQMQSVSEAVASGVGMAGCHGGMCDSFRNSVDWQFMTGSQWVSHPGGGEIEYKVNIKKNASSPIIFGIEDFMVKSEQYYIHIDPCVNVLATTRFPVANWYHATNGEVDVPVVYTKMWGMGRIFYNTLGHHDDIFDIPEAQELQRRGMLWAAEGKAVAGDYTKYSSTAKMF
ncbi:MAG: ThuA domain-containing protein [Clostridia bacterium]|nr:ThuA domain-containing protein [Clostridia bacterium]